MILLVYLACPALHIIDATLVHDLTKAHLRKKRNRWTTVPNHKHQCFSKNQYTEVYIFKPAYLAKRNPG